MPHTYQPLRHQGEFRLVKIQPSTNDSDTLDCRLMVRRIPEPGTSSEPLEYEAVSYVWGREPSAQLVLVDGWQRQIGQNLWDFLYHARKKLTSAPRLLWIDALCIDQNNVAERNAQVQHMGAIYRAAIRTLVWLGVGNVDVALAITYVREKIDNADTISFGRRDCPLPALQAWLHLPYWTRTWVVQEFLLSPDLLLIYGTLCVPVRVTLLFMKSLVKAKTENESGEIVESLLTSPGASLLLQRLSPMSTSTLASLLIRNQHSRCLEPRDKVYAILSLVKDQPQIVVDYGSNIRSLFRDILCMWSEQNNSVPNLLQLGTLLAKVLRLSADTSELLRDYKSTMAPTLTVAALSGGRRFSVRAYAVGGVDCHAVLGVPDYSIPKISSFDHLSQVAQTDTRFATWVHRFIHPASFKRMVKELAASPYIVTWMQHFWLTSIRAGVLKDGSGGRDTPSGLMPQLSLVGASLSMLRSHQCVIGLALGDIQTGDLMLQGLCHEAMFVCKWNREGKGMQSPPASTAVLVCARSGEPGRDPITHRSIPLVATTSEAEIKSPPVSTVIGFTVQEMLVLCSR